MCHKKYCNKPDGKTSRTLILSGFYDDFHHDFVQFMMFMCESACMYAYVFLFLNKAFVQLDEMQKGSKCMYMKSDICNVIKILRCIEKQREFF